MGLPIISTNVSDIPEICVDNYNGFLIEEKSSNAIIIAINKFISNNWLIDDFSKNSLKLSHNYDIEQNSFKKIKRLFWID